MKYDVKAPVGKGLLPLNLRVNLSISVVTESDPSRKYQKYNFALEILKSVNSAKHASTHFATPYQ